MEVALVRTVTESAIGIGIGTVTVRAVATLAHPPVALGMVPAGPHHAM